MQSFYRLSLIHKTIKNFLFFFLYALSVINFNKKNAKTENCQVCLNFPLFIWVKQEIICLVLHKNNLRYNFFFVKLCNFKIPIFA